ncbi:hypothetical protein AA0521_2187 [Komagataeibacter intermedius NRIC 0521]|nr:hypothetical protein AA0521_2187 [Komagataeibacter intermedius NRIC 0521]
MLASCSKSSVQLLKDGDPEVCTKTDVTDQLFEIIKDHANFPQNNGFVKDYEKARQKWISKVTFSISQITSKNVDKPNQQITCNGLVHMSASEIGQQDASVDYLIKSDLSNGKAIVEADLSNASYPIAFLLEKIGSPDLLEARTVGIKKNIAKADYYENKWVSSHSSEAKTIHENIEKTVKGNHFSQAEKDTAFKIEVFNKICRSEEDGQALACSRRDSLLQEAQGSGPIHLCYQGDFSGWKHCDGTDVENVPASIVTEPSSSDAFTPEDNKIIEQADYLNDKCRGGAGDQTESVCTQRDDLYNKMEKLNICWGPEDSAEYQKHWMRCHPK